MSRRILFFVTVILLAFACNEDADPRPACSVKDPVEDLEWLAHEIQTMTESSMSQYLYVTHAKLGSMTVFIFGNCCPNCLSITPVYNCAGEHIGNVGNGQDDIDPGILNHDVLLWTPENSSCSF